MAVQESKQKQAIDETGNRYGKLLVIGRGERGGKNKGADWLCQCDCGRTQLIYGTLLRAGRRTMCNECATKARERGEAVNYRPKYKPAEMTMQEFRYMQADNTFARLRKLRDALRIGDTYMVNIRLKSAEEYTAKCTLTAKHQKYALFKSERGPCYCFGYHAIMTDEIVYTDELVPRRVTV